MAVVKIITSIDKCNPCQEGYVYFAVNNQHMKIGKSVNVKHRLRSFNGLYKGFKFFAAIEGKEKEIAVQNIFLYHQCCCRLLDSDEYNPNSYLRRCDKKNKQTVYIYNIELFKLPYSSTRYVIKKLQTLNKGQL